jgi:uncharacterized protein
MSRPTHMPIRSCAGCGHRSPQWEMVRFVAADSGLRLDLERRLPGRGAYLHASEPCYVAFVARKPPLRSLRRSVDRPLRAALVEQLRPLVR